MLEPAIKYSAKLKNKMYDTWHDIKYQYYNCSPQEISIDENTYWRHQFVFIDNGEITGYFSYNIDHDVRSIHDFGLVSFTDEINFKFVRAVIRHIEEMFERGINRIEFFAYEDNPVNHSYKRLIEKFGGEQVGKLTNNTRLMDGKLHNTVFYELFSGDYFSRKAEKERKKFWEVLNSNEGELKF